MILLFVFLISLVFVNSEIGAADPKFAKNLKNQVINGNFSMFSDPIWIADCSGRFNAGPTPLKYYKNITNLFFVEDGFSYTENQKTVIRIGNNPMYYFKAKLQKNGAYLVDQIMKHCSAYDTAQDITNIYKHLGTTKNFAELLIVPFIIGVRDLKNNNIDITTYSLKRLADYNKVNNFDVRHGYYDHIESADFVKSGLLNHTINFKLMYFSNIGKPTIVEFTAVRNEKSQKYMIEKEYINPKELNLGDIVKSIVNPVLRIFEK